jgi:hypothetical protein
MYQTALDSLCPAPPEQALDTGQFFLQQPEAFAPLTDRLLGKLVDFISDPRPDDFAFFHGHPFPSAPATLFSSISDVSTTLPYRPGQPVSSRLLPGFARF